MKSDRSVSVVVPVYNEKDILAEGVGAMDDFLRAHFDRYEVLIIESGSTDGSSEASDRLAQDYPNVRVIHEGARNGFGSAVRLGYRSARMDLVWLITADLPFPLESVLDALPHLDANDAVLSYRVGDRRSVWRRTQSAVFNLLARRLLHLRTRHINSAFKLFKRDLIQRLSLQSNGWLLDAEILRRLEEAGVPWVEIPVPMIDRHGGSSSIHYTTGLKVARELFEFSANERRTARRNTAKERS